MKILYARSVIPASEKADRQINPRFFTQPVEGASLVIIEGDYPEIEAAYRGAGVKVQLLDDAPFTPPAVEAPKLQLSEVDLPTNWRSFGFQDLRGWATAITGKTPTNRKQALDLIEGIVGAE